MPRLPRGCLMRRWLLPALVLAGASAQGAPRTAWVAVGDCRDPALLRQAHALEAKLEERLGPQLVGEAQFQERVGLPPTHTLEEVQRQIATAENLFYNDRVADALGLLDQTLGELERLPPGAERWNAFSDAELIRGMALYAVRKRDASDDAFRAVLRVDSRHLMSAEGFSLSFLQRSERLRGGLPRPGRCRLTVQSPPPGAGVWVDVFLVAPPPPSSELPAGSYHLLAGKRDALSSPRRISLRGDT